MLKIKRLVPNVPCGVESNVNDFLRPDVISAEFLMYRVELKGTRNLNIQVQKRAVPNVPCGVESTMMFIRILWILKGS